MPVRLPDFPPTTALGRSPQVYWSDSPSTSDARGLASELAKVGAANASTIAEAYSALASALGVEVWLVNLGAARGDIVARLLLGDTSPFVALIDPDPTPSECLEIAGKLRDPLREAIVYQRLGHEFAHTFWYTRVGTRPTRAPRSQPDPREEEICDLIGVRLYDQIKRSVSVVGPGSAEGS